MSSSSHCCDQMRHALTDNDVPIVFVRKFREYGVKILDGGSSYIEFSHCPWCGKRLPKSLRDRWFDALEERNIDPAVDQVPDEFTDERWYQNLAEGDD